MHKWAQQAAHPTGFPLGFPMQEIALIPPNSGSMSNPITIPASDGFVPQGSVDFAWLTRAWAFFTAQPGVWVSAFLLYFLILVGLWVLWAIPTGGLAEIQRAFQVALAHGTPPPQSQNLFKDFLQSCVGALVFGGVNMIFFGGFYRMALQQYRGERLSALGLFSAFPQAVPLILVSLFSCTLLVLLQGFILWLLHRSGMAASAASIICSIIIFVPTTIIEGLLLFAPLLIIDRNLNAPEAIIGSFRLLRGQRIKAIFFYFVASLVGGLGFLFCGIGGLATYPVFLISIALGYVALMEPPPALVSPYNAPQEGVWPPPPRLDNNLPPV